jgi:hypothetical protein
LDPGETGDIDEQRGSWKGLCDCKEIVKKTRRIEGITFLNRRELSIF